MFNDPLPVNSTPVPVPGVTLAVVRFPVTFTVPVEMVIWTRLLLLFKLLLLGLRAMEEADNVPAPTLRSVGWFPLVAVVPFMVIAPAVNVCVPLKVKLFAVAPALKVIVPMV